MHSQLTELEIISQFLKEIQNKKSSIEIAWYLTENIISNFDFEDCVIYLLDHDSEKLIQVAALGPKNPSRFVISDPLKLDIGEGIVGSSAKAKETICVSDTEKDERYIVDDKTRKSEIAVPVIFLDKVYAVIDCESSVKNFFQEKHKILLECIANIAATKFYLGYELSQIGDNQDLSLPSIFESLYNTSGELKKYKREKLEIKQEKFIHLEQPLNSAISALQTLNVENTEKRQKYMEILQSSLLEIKSHLDKS